MPLLARAKADVAHAARLQRRAQREPPEPALRLPLRRTPHRTDSQRRLGLVVGRPGHRARHRRRRRSRGTRELARRELLHRRRLLRLARPTPTAGRPRQRASLLASGSSLRALARSSGTKPIPTSSVDAVISSGIYLLQRGRPRASSPTECAIWSEFQITHTAFMCSLLVGIGWLNEGRQRRLGGRAEPKPAGRGEGSAATLKRAGPPPAHNRLSEQPTGPHRRRRHVNETGSATSLIASRAAWRRRPASATAISASSARWPGEPRPTRGEPCRHDRARASIRAETPRRQRDRRGGSCWRRWQCQQSTVTSARRSCPSRW